MEFPAVVGGRRVVGWWVIPAGAVLAILIAAVFYHPWRATAQSTVTGQFYSVVPMDLEVKVNKDGELQAVSYTDVKSEVEGVTQIIELVSEGTFANKGDMLVRLDSANLKTKKEQIDLDLKKAESLLKISQEMKGIQENTNNTNMEAAEVGQELAELDLKQYVDGLYPQLLENARTTLSMAQTTLKNKEEELSQTKGLFNRAFVNAADVKKAELDVIVASNDLKKAEKALEVLEKYQHPMDLAKLKSAVAQAEQKVNRTIRINKSEMAQRDADLAEKNESLKILKRQQAKLEEQISACEIKAPEDGLVIYSSSIERNQREPVQEGTTVRQSQWLIRLPNTKTMKAVLKIQEAQKPKLDENKGQRALVKILGVPEPIGATLTKVSVLPDNGARWWNPDLREYPVELTLDKTPQGLKPGVRVENAEIFISRQESVLGVPLAALYGVGKDSFVFVREGDTVKERRVTIGTANETHVEVTQGLKAGEQVMLLAAGQGRTLLEKAGIKVVEPPAQRPPEREKRANNGKGRDHPPDGPPGPPRNHGDQETTRADAEKADKAGPGNKTASKGAAARKGVMVGTTQDPSPQH
jgi:HlyD family secretion protein